VDKKGIGLLPNLDKPESEELVDEIILWLGERNIEAYLPPCAEVFEKWRERILRLDDWPFKVDFAIVLGGDGSLLAAARSLGPLGIPILGVTLGISGSLQSLKPTICLPIYQSLFPESGIKMKGLCFLRMLLGKGKLYFLALL